MATTGSHHHSHHGHHGNSTLGSSAQTTLHCLTGCLIGEFAGLAIGTSLGLGVALTITLAVGLAYISGFALAVFPLMRRENLTFRQAMSVIWIGEAISIGAMEIAMNGVDYAVGGMTAGSVFAPMFWMGLAAAIPAGFLAAWPVNFYLLKRQLKRCH